LVANEKRGVEWQNRPKKYSFFEYFYVGFFNINLWINISAKRYIL